METNNKRIYRNDMSVKQRQAISQALKGRKHTEQHKINISKAMTEYWNNLPYKPENNNGETDMGDMYEN